MQCRLIFWLFSVAIIHKASGKPQSSTRLCSSVHALRYSLLQGERCPTLSCFFGKPQPRWGSRKLNITPDFIAGSRGWPIVSYLEKGHRKKITEQKSQKQPPNQPPSCPCFDIGGGGFPGTARPVPLPAGTGTRWSRGSPRASVTSRSHQELTAHVQTG